MTNRSSLVTPFWRCDVPRAPSPVAAMIVLPSGRMAFAHADPPAMHITGVRTSELDFRLCWGVRVGWRMAALAHDRDRAGRMCGDFRGHAAEQAAQGGIGARTQNNVIDIVRRCEIKNS